MVTLKLKGYILLESMIAMIIVMLCFGFSVMIYNNVVTGSRNKLKVRARICLENEAIKSKLENRMPDETVEYDEFHIEKKMVPYSTSSNLYQLNYKALTPDGIALAEYHEIIYTP
jgi:hypothetical protein